MNKSKRSPAKTILRVIGFVLLAVVLVFAVGIGWLTAVEFRPKDVEDAEILGTADTGTLSTGDSLTVMTWNIGYGALGDNADFFMDGGTMVRTADESRLQKNMDGIIGTIRDADADAVFLQETDRCSDRTYRLDEAALITGTLYDYTWTFANNFKSAFVPYPVPPIGKVDAGLLTLCRYAADGAERVQLPIPFKWPVRTINLKRCLLVERIHLEDSPKDLVLINLHLEAYDSGEGKIAQTNKLKEVIGAELEKGNYVIVGGDFNQTFSNIDTSAYPSINDGWTPGLIDADEFTAQGWQLIMDPSAPTCRTLETVYADADKDSVQYYVIDGFIVSPNLTVDSIRTIDADFVYSDHNPVVLTVTVDKQDRS